jgi:hypothetical protein
MILIELKKDISKVNAEKASLGSFVARKRFSKIFLVKEVKFR